jgi:hypothetical protein
LIDLLIGTNVKTGDDVAIKLVSKNKSQRSTLIINAGASKNKVPSIAL